MKINKYFKGDDNQRLKDLQYQISEISLLSIFNEIKAINKNKDLLNFYFPIEEIDENIRNKLFLQNKEKIENNYNYLQETLNHLEAVFRYNYNNGLFESELFDLDKKEIFDYFYNFNCDLNILNNITIENLNILYKWNKYLLEIINNNQYILRELILAAIIYNDSRELVFARVASENSVKLILQNFKEIPWITNKTNYRYINNKHEAVIENEKIEYLLYDYNEKCTMGYGGVSFHKGYIIFYQDCLGIEDHETDRDHWDDAWYGSSSNHYILSEYYPQLITKLNKLYEKIDINRENEINKNIYFTLKSDIERELFCLLLSVIYKNNNDITYAGGLTKDICGDEIPYQHYYSRYDDFYPECESCNCDEYEVVNGS